MPRYWVNYDERYPTYDLHSEKESWLTKTVELTEEEAKCFTASQILYDYWQEFVERKLEEQGQ